MQAISDLRQWATNPAFGSGADRYRDAADRVEDAIDVLCIRLLDRASEEQIKGNAAGAAAFQEAAMLVRSKE